jgi:hypothetical protein
MATTVYEYYNGKCPECDQEISNEYEENHCCCWCEFKFVLPTD